MTRRCSQSSVCRLGAVVGAGGLHASSRHVGAEAEVERREETAVASRITCRRHCEVRWAAEGAGGKHPVKKCRI